VRDWAINRPVSRERQSRCAFGDLHASDLAQAVGHRLETRLKLPSPTPRPECDCRPFRSFLDLGQSNLRDQVKGITLKRHLERATSSSRFPRFKQGDPKQAMRVNRGRRLSGDRF
jgi:hypothetical protein